MTGYVKRINKQEVTSYISNVVYDERRILSNIFVLAAQESLTNPCSLYYPVYAFFT